MESVSFSDAIEGRLPLRIVYTGNRADEVRDILVLRVYKEARSPMVGGLLSFDLATREIYLYKASQVMILAALNKGMISPKIRERMCELGKEVKERHTPDMETVWACHRPNNYSEDVWWRGLQTPWVKDIAYYTTSLQEREQFVQQLIYMFSRLRSCQIDHDSVMIDAMLRIYRISFEDEPARRLANACYQSLKGLGAPAIASLWDSIYLEYYYPCRIRGGGNYGRR
jgi:hypothetical protein